jgi:hypothetical protein
LRQSNAAEFSADRPQDAAQSPPQNEREEITMKGKKGFVALAVTTTALGILGTAAEATRDRNDPARERGAVVPCSLDGVNPVYHPEIFGNPAAAAAYGFVRSPNGAWQVRPNCRR